ncbi:MAG: carboxypeptidase regulatory-like domain-containing protein [Armatimonadia bacterium]
MRWRYGCLLLLLCGGVGYGRDITLTGKVLGPAGEGLAGCRVVAIDRPRDHTTVTAEGVTDAAGSFSLTVAEGGGEYSQCQVVAISPDYSLDWSRRGDQKPLTLRLQEHPLTCGGVVTTVTGEPVAGAEVTLVTLSREFEGHWSQSKVGLHCWDGRVLGTITDAQGRFSLGDLPPGSIASLRVTAPGFGKLQRWQILAGENDLHVYLHAEGRISGRVIYEGKPVAGAQVDTGNLPEMVVSAADGTFTYGGLSAGMQVLSARTDDFTGVSEVVRIGAGEHREGVIVNLQRPATIKGRCVDEKTGAPLPDFPLRALTAGPLRMVSHGTVFTAADGTFSQNVLPGSVSVYGHYSIEISPLRSLPRPFRANLAPGQVLATPDLKVETHNLVRGRVLLPDGTPAAGAEIGTLARSGYSTASSDFYELRTDADGKFSIPAIQWARMVPHWIIARDTRRNLAAALAVPDAANEATITLQPAAWLVTQVVTDKGEPVPGWPVEFLAGDVRQYSRPVPGACSDAAGQVRLGPLPPNVALKVRLGENLDHLLANKQEFDDLQFTLQPGERKQVSPLQVAPQGRTVRGWVGDDQQRPLAGALVVGERAARIAMTDAQGHFELTGLPLRGKVRLVAMHPTLTMLAGTSVDPDWGQEPGLVPAAPGSLTVRVKRPDGTPATSVIATEQSLQQVWLISAELSERLEDIGYQQLAPADEQGAIRVDGLIPGLTYAFVLFDLDEKLKPQTHSFVAESGKTLDLGEITMEAQ